MTITSEDFNASEYSLEGLPLAPPGDIAPPPASRPRRPRRPRGGRHRARARARRRRRGLAPPADDVDADAVAVPRAPWDVRERHVRALPSFYPLEKSSVVVRAAAGVIAARIVSVLKSRGVAASYDAPNAKADCVSADAVEFRVRLYRARGEGAGLVVEVQRRDGFALSYIQDVFAILDAVQGKELEEPA